MRHTLPQANDLDKVIEIMTYLYYHPCSSYQNIADYIGFTHRQAQYYVGACQYLNLIDENRKPTYICEKIFKDPDLNITEGVYEQIMNDELMGNVFIHTLLKPNSDLDKYARDISELFHPEIKSDITIERRAHCIVLWTKKIRNYIQLKN